MTQTKSDIEAVFRRHIEAAPYAKDLILRIGFEVVPLVTKAPKRWLIEETLEGGSIRWQVVEHEHQASEIAESRGAKVTPLFIL